MKALSLIKFMTFVSMVIVTCTTAWGEALGVRSADDEIKVNNNAACTDAVSKYSEADSASFSMCKKLGDSAESCSTALDDCSSSASAPSPLQFPAVNGVDLFAFDDGEKSCIDLTYSEYDTKLDKLERKDEKITDELSRLKKDQEREEEKYQESAAKLQKEVSELIDEKSKAELEDKENDRKAEGEEKVALDDLRKQIRKSENEVLSAMGKLTEMANSRQRKVSVYRKKILMCKLEAEKVASERKKMPKQSGNLNSATQSGASNNQVIQEIYQTCVQDVISEKNSDEDSYQTQVKNVNKFIADTEAEIKEMKASEQLAMQQAAQSKIDKANNRQQRDQSFLQKYQSMLEQRKASDQLMTNKRTRAQMEVNQAQTKANTASSELAAFGRSKPVGRKSSEDIGQAIQNARNASDRCQAVCSLVNRESECDRLNKGKKSSPVKPSGTAQGVTGG